MERKGSYLLCRAHNFQGSLFAGERLSQPVEKDVDDGSRVKRQYLAEKQTAQHRDAQRPPKFRADTRAEGERYARKKRRQGRHQDGAETQKRSFVNRLRGGKSARPFSL